MSATESQHPSLALKGIRHEVQITCPRIDHAEIKSPFTDSVDEWDASLRPLPEDYHATSNTRRAVPAEVDDLERELAGAEVKVKFHFSTSIMKQEGVAKRITEHNGEPTVTHKFYMGQNIEHLKFFLHQFCGLPYEKISLYMGNLLLMDPLSLSDLPFKVDENNDLMVSFTE